MSFLTICRRRIFSSRRVGVFGPSDVARTISTTLLYVFLLIGNDLSSLCDEIAARCNVLLLPVLGFVADCDDVNDLRLNFRINVQPRFFQRLATALLVDRNDSHRFKMNETELDLQWLSALHERGMVSIEIY